jgi:hypothetical protein
MVAGVPAFFAAVDYEWPAFLPRTVAFGFFFARTATKFAALGTARNRAATGYSPLRWRLEGDGG